MADEFVQVVKFKVDDSELVAAIERMRKAFGDGVGSMGKNPAEGLEKGLKKASKEAQKTAKEAQNISKATKAAAKETNGLATAFERMSGAVKGLVAAYAGFRGVQALVGFGQGSIELFNAQRRQELMLDTVLRNNGMAGASASIKRHASAIQKRSTIGDEAMIAGAAELSTYVRDPQQLKRMMNLLADYSMGMTGGAALSPESMTNLATGLGKAFDGTYEALRKKGFDTSELETITNALKLKEDLEKGNIARDKKTGELKLSNDEKELLKWLNENRGRNVEDLKITALENAMKDWKGLSDEFAKTDEGKIQQLKNTIGDMREEIGSKLLPVVGKLASDLKSNLPTLEHIFDSLREAIVSMIDAVRNNLEGIKQFASVISKLAAFIAGHIQSIIAFGVALKTIKTFAPMASTGMGLVAAGIIGLAAAAIETSRKLRQARENDRYADAESAVNAFRRKKERVIQLKKEGKTFDQLSGKSVSALENEVMQDQKRVQRIIADYANSERQNGNGNGVSQEWLDVLGMSKGFDYKSGGRNYHVYGKDANGDVTGFAEWKKKEEEFRDMYKSVQKDEMLTAKGGTTINNINYTNNIEVNSDELAKQVKENLRTLLTSQLTFVSRSETARAMAL